MNSSNRINESSINNDFNVNAVNDIENLGTCSICIEDMLKLVGDQVNANNHIYTLNKCMHMHHSKCLVS